MPSLAISMLVILIQLGVAGGIQSPSGPLRAAVPEDMGPHPSKSSTYNELWTFVFQFDDESQLFLNFTRANLGPKDPVCGSDALLTGFRGKSYSVAREYPLKNFQYDALNQGISVHELIHFGQSHADTQVVFFETEKKGVHWWMELKVITAEKGAVWGDGIFNLDDNQVGLFMHIPKAKAQGRIAINGDTVAVSGTAYMDHTYQTAFVPRLARKGLRIVQHRGGYEVGQYFEASDDYNREIFGYGIREEGGSRRLLRPQSLNILATSKDMGVRVPTRLTLTFTDASPLQFERTKDRAQASTLREFGLATRLFLRQFLGGEVLTFSGIGKVGGQGGAAYRVFVVD